MMGTTFNALIRSVTIRQADEYHLGAVDSAQFAPRALQQLESRTAP